MKTVSSKQNPTKQQTSEKQGELCGKTLFTNTLRISDAFNLLLSENVKPEGTKVSVISRDHSPVGPIQNERLF